MFSNYDKHLQELSFNSSIKTATDEDIFKILRTECCGGKCFRKIEEDISYDKTFDLIKRLKGVLHFLTILPSSNKFHY